MNQTQFDQQIQRLVNNFGKGAYSTERVVLIWREVNSFSADWLERSVDKFIGKERYAPLLPQFQAEISEERERIWQDGKNQREKEAKRFFEGSYLLDEIKTICQCILKRLSGGVFDPDFHNFIKHLTHAARALGQKSKANSCGTCEGDGYIMWNPGIPGDYVFRCSCPEGQKKPKAHPVWQRS